MTPVKHTVLDKQLKEFKNTPAPQLFLIYGDPFLVKNAFDAVRSFLLKGENSQFALETLEGGSVSMTDIIEELSTYSFMVKQKIVAVKNIPLFQTRNNPDEIGFSSADHQLFAQFLEKGMPEEHCLILTCPGVDKRLKFYKTIEDKGLVIDCSVSQGTRKADLDDQNQVLGNIADSILNSSGKTIIPRAFNLLVELTGFNPELFSQNLEKLITYVGKNTSISIED
ncbi:MAG: DNA polymerase III subunit delta, partial [Proteobacteria bacterium]|nr:DNA polymerase III subunit delta [Pseudomonadota bacterium]